MSIGGLGGLVGRLLGLEEAQRIEAIEPSLGAPWAHDAPAWLLFACVAAAVVAVVFYVRYQRHRSAPARAVLAVLRGAALAMIVLMLAEPVLTVTLSAQRRPAVWLLLDGSDSMNIVDPWSGPELERLAAAVGLSAATGGDGAAGSAGGAAGGTTGGAAGASPSVPGGAETTAASLSRTEWVKALLRKDGGAMLRQLADRYRLRAFVFDRPDGVRSLELTSGPREEIDVERLVSQWNPGGDVTALGAALADLARRHASGQLSALVVFSDFNQNAGPPAVAAARELGVPLLTVGVGPAAAVDLALTIDAPLHVKKDEQGTIAVVVRQQGLDGQTIQVRLSAGQAGEADAAASAFEPIGEKTVTLESASQQRIDFPYVPERAGRFTLLAEVEPVAGEVVEENNRARRDVTVLDDFLRLLFVEYEPTWEWRFIKEVFHRDKLVGMKGFRTFLRSSDPRVRQTNEMFLPTMSLSRSEFFAHDVIFLGDLPSSALNPRFCEMVDEFVRHFRGGLVVIAGPRFGVGQLADTPLGALLPVKVDPRAKINDRQPFRLQISPRAFTVDFMRLGGENEAESRKAWDNLGELPWYQPVERPHPLATVLAEHPSHTCVDGKTRQPIIAIHTVGNGEVVYVGLNETWRLRRMYGEKYYRQFWGQMIHRLGLSHELGGQKRFVVRTDRQRYQADEEVVLSVEAYDADYQPLKEADLPGRKLAGELILPVEGSGSGGAAQPLALTMVRDGLYEARFPVYAGGEYRARVHDPITDKPVDTVFQVAAVSVERQSAVRNVALQDALARLEAGGKSYDLASAVRLADELRLEAKTETTVEVIPLWNTWLLFVAVVGALLGEWLLRKWVNLT